MSCHTSKGAPTKLVTVEEMDAGSPRPGPSSRAVGGGVPMSTDESSQDSQSTTTSEPSSRSSASQSGPSEDGGCLAERQNDAGEFHPQVTASQKRQLKRKQKTLQAGLIFNISKTCPKNPRVKISEWRGKTCMMKDIVL